MAYNVFQNCNEYWDFSRKKKKTGTKCGECGLELYEQQRLERHMKKAHGNVPEKKLDESAGDGGLW